MKEFAAFGCPPSIRLDDAYYYYSVELELLEDHLAERRELRVEPNA